MRDCAIGRLGCVADGKPYVVPVSYVYDDSGIYIHSLPGHKITAMRANPEVCVQADQITSEYSWRSVVAFGRYEEISEPAERDRYLKLLFQRFPHLTPVEALQTSDQAERHSVVFRIRVERITGVAEG